MSFIVLSFLLSKPHRTHRSKKGTKNALKTSGLEHCQQAGSGSSLNNCKVDGILYRYATSLSNTFIYSNEGLIELQLWTLS